MKKLFVAALSTLLVLGMAACGSKKASSSSQQGEKTANDYSDTVIKDGDTVYGMVGPSAAYINGEAIGARAWGAATPEFGAATATSLRDVAQRDLKVAEAFEGKDLKGLYKVEKVELGHQALAGYMKGAYNEKGEYVERDGVYTVKFVKYGVDEETSNPFIDTWLPSPEAYGETLTPATFWAPPHQEAKDEHGLAHDSDSVNLAGAGEYTYYIGVYKKAVNGAYYGFAVFQDKQLTEFVPPEDQVIYSIPGQWNGWNNSAEMTKVNDNQYTAELTVAAGDNGRITETGTWTTAADVRDVTVGASLVEDDNGGDHNFKFLAAGTYTVTLNIGAGDVKTISIVAA